MPGGVAGARLTAAPYADQCFGTIYKLGQLATCTLRKLHDLGIYLPTASD